MQHGVYRNHHLNQTINIVFSRDICKCKGGAQIRNISYSTRFLHFCYSEPQFMFWHNVNKFEQVYILKDSIEWFYVTSYFTWKFVNLILNIWTYIKLQSSPKWKPRLFKQLWRYTLPFLILFSCYRSLDGLQEFLEKVQIRVRIKQRVALFITKYVFTNRYNCTRKDTIISCVKPFVTVAKSWNRSISLPSQRFKFSIAIPVFLLHDIFFTSRDAIWFLRNISRLGQKDRVVWRVSGSLERLLKNSSESDFEGFEAFGNISEMLKQCKNSTTDIARCFDWRLFIVIWILKK